MDLASTKKRKLQDQDASLEDASSNNQLENSGNSLVDLVQDLLRMVNAKKPPPTSSSFTERGVRKRSVELKDELQRVEEMKEQIDNLLQSTINDAKQPIEKELAACIDSTTPLLSLGHPLLGRILDYCDESALLHLETASDTVFDLARSTSSDHWILLHALRGEQQIGGEYKGDASVVRHRDGQGNHPTLSSLLDSLRNAAQDTARFGYLYSKQENQKKQGTSKYCVSVKQFGRVGCRLDSRTEARERSRYFGYRANQAYQLETIGEQIYDYTEETSKVQYLTTHSDDYERLQKYRCAFFENIDELYDGDEMFLRISRLSDSFATASTSGCSDPGGHNRTVVWQGFAYAKDEVGSKGLFDMTDKVAHMDWPEFREIIAMSQQSPSFMLGPYKDKLKHILGQARFTLLFPEKWFDGIVTGGFHDIVEGNTVLLHPRNPREDDVTSTVNVSVQPRLTFWRGKLFFDPGLKRDRLCPGSDCGSD